MLHALTGRTPDHAAATDENAADASLTQADSFAHLMSMKATGGGSYLVGQPLTAPASTLWGQLRLAVSTNLAPARP